MTTKSRHQFKTIWEAVAAAKSRLDEYRSDPSPDLQQLKQDLHELRSHAGRFFNIENPYYRDDEFVLPLSKDELESVYGGALYYTVLANYLSHYIRELEELQSGTDIEC